MKMKQRHPKFGTYSQQMKMMRKIIYNLFKTL